MNTANFRPQIFLFIFFALTAGCKQSSIIQGHFADLEYHLTLFQNPQPKEGFPLLLVLHGTGDSGKEYLQLWKSEADRRKIVLLAPTLTRGYQKESADLKIFDQLIEEVSRRYPVNGEKIYLAGISSGALIARWLLMNHPERWKAVILIASPGYESWTSRVDVETLPPILFVHGEKDEQFPIKQIEEHVKILKEKGVETDLWRYPAGHEQKEEWSSDIFDWIENHSVR